MYRIDVLISGRGSLLPPLAEAAREGVIPARIGRVISDRPGAPGMGRARNLGIETLCIDRRKHRSSGGPTLSDAILDEVRGRADLLVLAGFLSILEGALLEEFAGRMLNIHPALLPSHGGRGMYGMRVHEEVLAAGERKSGCTVHFVTAGVDRGPMVLQRSVPIEAGETAESLRAKVHGIEAPALVEAVRLVLEGEV